MTSHHTATLCFFLVATIAGHAHAGLQASKPKPVDTAPLLKTPDSLGTSPIPRLPATPPQAPQVPSTPTQVTTYNFGTPPTCASTAKPAHR